MFFIAFGKRFLRLFKFKTEDQTLYRKIQINIFAYSHPEQPGPGAPILGLDKSIYHSNIP